MNSSISEPYVYDGIIIITAPDLRRVQKNLHRMAAHMPVRKLVFVGSEEVGQLVESMSDLDAVFINENDIIKFEDVNNVLKERLAIEDVPRGITGWYYQQFLKMGYANVCQDEYYLVWDGDTIPCADFSMFKQGTKTPYLDVKHEHNEEYFITMDKLLPGFHKVIGKSFIAEHMLFNCEIMKSLIADIEKNHDIKGNVFYEKILNAVRQEVIRDSSFSEFETYGTYVALKCSDAYMLRDWHSLRLGSIFFKPDEINDDDFKWLAQDFHAISFEKDSEYVPEYADFFSNPKYRQTLKPHHIIEAIQEENAITSNVTEKWE